MKSFIKIFGKNIIVEIFLDVLQEEIQKMSPQRDAKFLNFLKNNKTVFAKINHFIQNL